MNVNMQSAGSLIWSILTAMKNSMTITSLVFCVLYAVLLLLIVVFGKGNERTFFGIYPMLLIGVILNPWFIEFMCFKFDAGSRYFRYFWCIPIMSGYAYFGYLALARCSSKKMRTVLPYIASFVLIFLCSKYLISRTRILNTGAVPNTGCVAVTNIYRLQQDIVDAADLINEDKADDNRQVYTLCDYNMMSCIRTYNASIIFRWPVDVSRWFDLNNVDQAGLDGYIAVSDWDAVLRVLVNEHIGKVEPLYINPALLRTALKSCEIEYVIIRKDKSTIDSFYNVADLIGETDNYLVFKVKVYG